VTDRRGRRSCVIDSRKVCVDGIANVAGHGCLRLRMIQAGGSRPGRASRSSPTTTEDATWLTDRGPRSPGRFPFETPHPKTCRGLVPGRFRDGQLNWLGASWTAQPAAG